jgi:hypothetical protein
LLDGEGCHAKNEHGRVEDFQEENQDGCSQICQQNPCHKPPWDANIGALLSRTLMLSVMQKPAVKNSYCFVKAAGEELPNGICTEYDEQICLSN